MNNAYRKEREDNISYIDDFLLPKIDTQLPNGRIILDGGADLPRGVRHKPDDILPPTDSYNGNFEEE